MSSERKKRKQRIGIVISDKMQKTRVVQVERLTSHPVYSRVIKRKKKFKVHDEKNASKVGDKVKLTLDWKHRFNTMRLHAALHLLAGVFDSKFKERAVAGVVKPGNATLVFKHEIPDEIINTNACIVYTYTIL